MKVFALPRKGLLPVLALGALVLMGCNGSQDAAHQEEMSGAARPMSPEVQAFVNQGNDAQRAGNFEEAMGAYEDAMALDPQHPVPQFGALMVAMATGNDAVRDSLTEILRVSAPELVAMLGPDGSMGAGTPGGMPSDPHAGMAMPGGMGSAPPIEGADVGKGLPAGHPALSEVGPADTIRPDTAGSR